MGNLVVVAGWSRNWGGRRPGFHCISITSSWDKYIIRIQVQEIIVTSFSDKLGLFLNWGHFDWQPSKKYPLYFQRTKSTPIRNCHINLNSTTLHTILSLSTFNFWDVPLDLLLVLWYRYIFHTSSPFQSFPADNHIWVDHGTQAYITIAMTIRKAVVSWCSSVEIWWETDMTYVMWNMYTKSTKMYISWGKLLEQQL
jgi:hypothetical protein